MLLRNLVTRRILSSKFCNSILRCNTFKRCLSTKNESNNEEEAFFGYERLEKKLKAEKVYKVFENVADKYDDMNDYMSLGIHRIWKDIFVERLGPVPGVQILDVAGGTGDIAFRLHKYLKYISNGITDEVKLSKVIVCDINKEMLRVGQKRAEKLGLSDIQWIEGNAECLSFPDDCFDGYTIAFGMRNVVNINKALDEAYRVLKPGGRFMCLEFSKVHNDIIKQLYDSYSFEVIPVIGQIIAGDFKSYKYLVESIRKFPDQEKYKKMIQDAGFWNVTYENLTFGIVAIHSGFKL